MDVWKHGEMSKFADADGWKCGIIPEFVKNKWIVEKCVHWYKDVEMFEFQKGVGI